ncbi:PD40 domain-containing protein [Thermanaeromonas sp. C210]|uniref:PD40 domain-containing protein n=1 Tax=Thermanaeromonas sp. C210 TaxID=2731925 RepID=UPI0015665760|nr:PD40 domain-containing protein [Thermanaeromonas sp. C210]
MAGEVLIKEGGGIGERTITGAYVLVDNKLKETPTETVSITINKGKPNEYSFQLVKIMKNGQVVSVRPAREGGPLYLTVGKKRVVFTDLAHKSLWVADLATLDQPKNIQPEVVGNISQQDLYKKKEELAKRGIDPDERILYWVSQPILSPDENNIAFSSNRLGYPGNCNSSLWLTDLQGNTRLLVDERDRGSIVPVCWANYEVVIYQGAAGELKSVNVNTGKTEVLVNHEIMITGASPDGKYIIYNPSKDGLVQPDHYVFNFEERKSYYIAVPEGFRTQGFYGWDEDNKKVAFYVQDAQAKTKLLILDCASMAVTSLDAPEGKTFEQGGSPEWVDGRVIFAAGGKLYAYQEMVKV